MSPHMQPTLPVGSNQVGEEWKDAVHAAKKSINFHKQGTGQGVTAVEPQDAGPSQQADDDQPTPHATGVTTPATPATPGSRGVDNVSQKTGTRTERSPFCVT